MLFVASHQTRKGWKDAADTALEAVSLCSLKGVLTAVYHMCATSKHQLDHYPWNQTRSDACTGWRRILVVSYLTSNFCRSMALFLLALQFQIHWIQRDMNGFTLDFMFNIKWVLVHHIFSIVSALPSLDWITTNGLKLNLCVWLFWTLTPATWMPEFSFWVIIPSNNG